MVVIKTGKLTFVRVTFVQKGDITVRRILGVCQINWSFDQGLAS
jgi:hypothetical protein